MTAEKRRDLNGIEAPEADAKLLAEMAERTAPKLSNLIGVLKSDERKKKTEKLEEELITLGGFGTFRINSRL